MNQPLSAYVNESYHLGVNLRESRLDIGEWYATYIANLDISVKGIRAKRKEPKAVATLKNSPTGYVNGMAHFVDINGVPWLISALDGKVYAWDGVANGTQGNGHVVEYPAHLPDGSTHYDLNTTGRIRFARVYNNLYGVDGSKYLFKFDGTKVQAVVGVAQQLPIIPGTVVMSNGNTADDVVDDGNGNLLQYTTEYVGTISYSTGVYTFSPSFPWANSTVVCNYDYALPHAAEELWRAAVDGTLQYPALTKENIIVGTLTLTDGTNTLTSNGEDASGFPSGWKKIINNASAQVGGYDPVSGKFQVTTASAFNANSEISASFSIPELFTGETVEAWGDNFSSDYYIPAGNVAHAPVVINGTDPDDVGILFSGVFTNALIDLKVKNNGDIYPVNDNSNIIGTFDFQNGSWQSMGALYTSPLDTSGPISYYGSSAQNEVVGTSDSTGKLYRFKTSVAPAAYEVRVFDGGGNLAKGVPEASPTGNLYKGASAVGTIDNNGIISITAAGTFVTSGVCNVTYYTSQAATETTLQFGALGGSLGGTIPFGGQDILWWNNRLFITGDNSLAFSDAYTPETFSDPPLAVSATGKLKLLGYSYNRLYLFNAEAGALGEIFYVDVTATDPATWKAVSLFGGMNFLSTDCIIRAASNDSSDIFYWTAEGWRTMRTTIQDAAAGPSLPIDLNVRQWFDDLDPNELSKSWAIVFDDELLSWHCKDGSSSPDIIHAYNMKIQRQTQQDGWTLIDMPSYTNSDGIEAHCGAIQDFGTGKCLYIGSATGGKIIQMFHSHQNHYTASEISKGITFTSPESLQNKFCSHAPRQLLVRTSDDSAAAGVLSAYLIDDQGSEFAIGTKTIESSGIKNPLKCFDISYPTSGTMLQRMRPSTDWRVKLTTTADMKIQGFELVADSFKPRFVQFDENNATGSAATDTELSVTTLADTAI